MKGIDALRSIAVLLVFVFHCFMELPSDGGVFYKIYSNPWNHFFPHHLGVLGVQLFFVISGFCIHRSTLDWALAHRTAPPTSMWLAYGSRRFWRIMPLYMIVLLVLWGLAVNDMSSLSSWADLTINAAMLQTLVPGHLNLINPSFWSLAVEVQLYLLYPLVWMSMRRWGTLRALLACGAFCLAWRLLIPLFWLDNWWVSLPWRWGYEWILGVGVAATQHYKRSTGGWALLLLGAGITAIMLLSRSATQNDVFAPLLFALVVRWIASRTIEFPASLVALGGLSYAFYLVHQPVLGAVAKLFSFGGATRTDSGMFLAACLLGFVLSLAIAVPLERFGRWLISTVKPGSWRGPIL